MLILLFPPFLGHIVLLHKSSFTLLLVFVVFLILAIAPICQPFQPFISPKIIVRLTSCLCLDLCYFIFRYNHMFGIKIPLTLFQNVWCNIVYNIVRCFVAIMSVICCKSIIISTVLALSSSIFCFLCSFAFSVFFRCLGIIVCCV